jgi:hypothetical protein
VRNRSNSRVTATAGIIGRNPREAVGLFVMGAAVTIIFVNALFMQKGPHPAPIFAPKHAVAPMPLSRFMPPAPQVQSMAQPVAVPAPAPRPHIEQSAAPARGNDPIAALLAPSNRVTAAQQVLAQYGYGQIRPNGVVGPETQDAIRRFERSQKMPVTGQLSDQVVKALAQMSGRSLD